MTPWVRGVPEGKQVNVESSNRPTFLLMSQSMSLLSRKARPNCNQSSVRAAAERGGIPVPRPLDLVGAARPSGPCGPDPRRCARWPSRCVVALGIAANGQNHALSFWEGSAGSTEMRNSAGVRLECLQESSSMTRRICRPECVCYPLIAHEFPLSSRRGPGTGRSPVEFRVRVAGALRNRKD